jgi:hypothetical protein
LRQFKEALEKGDPNYYGYIESLYQSFTLAEFEQYWELLKKSSPTQGPKIAFQQMALGRLASLGQTDEALNLARETFGPGSNHEGAIKTIFSGSSLPLDQLTEIIPTLDYDTEKAAALKGITEKIGKFASIEEARPLFSNPSVLAHSALANGITRYFINNSGQAGFSYESSLSTLADLCKSSSSKKSWEILAGVLASSAAMDPFSAWKVANATSGPGQESLKGALPQISLEMIRVAPAEALEEIRKSSSSSTQLLESSFSTWLDADSHAAREWFLKNNRTLTDPEATTLRRSFVRLALRSSEFDVARSWAGDIANPETKEQVLAEIRSAEAGRKGTK